MLNFFTLKQKNFFIIYFFITIFICIFFIPFISTNLINNNSLNSISTSNISENIPPFKLSSSNFLWPLPGYTRISSPFGYRSAPTAGATSFHGGIDIPAPPGTNIISAIDGQVTFTGFMGSGGCTVVITGLEYTIVCHHVSPNFIVSKRRLCITRSNNCQCWP